jgi:NAD(P)-dependent dehydrogenase (short-subunit alcohol dehydrogenase family)
METNQSVALVTGANRGIGRALTEALVRGGAAKVYAAARDPRQLESLVAAGGGKVIALALDVTDKAQVKAAAARASDVTVLFNNAGVLSSGSLMDSTDAQLEQELSVNYLGALAMTRAFVPVLERTPASAIVNVLTVLSLAPMQPLGGYAASKAAAWSMTLALRGQLAARGIQVFGVYPGPIDTDMSRGIDMPKTSPEEAAANILAGLQANELDIYPDSMSKQMGELWRNDPEKMQRQFAAM